MNVSVILPTYNVEKNIEDLLISICSQDYESNIEIVIIDSSNDNTPQIANKFPNVKLLRIEPEEYTYGGSRNEGLKYSSGEYLVFLSADIEIDDNKWLTKLVRNLNDPLVAGVYGKQMPRKDSTPMEDFFIRYTYPNERKEFSINNQGKIEEIFFSNVNSAIKREILNIIPLPVMLVTEELEWAKRAIFAEYKIIYESEAGVIHSHNYSLKELFKRFYGYGAGHSYIFRKNNKIKKPNYYIKGITYEFQQIIYLIKRKKFFYIPYSLIYDFIRLTGYFLGTKYRYMPLSLRKKFSVKANYWDMYDDVIDRRYKNE